MSQMKQSNIHNLCRLGFQSHIHNTQLRLSIYLTQTHTYSVVVMSIEALDAGPMLCASSPDAGYMFMLRCLRADRLLTIYH